MVVVWCYVSKFQMSPDKNVEKIPKGITHMTDLKRIRKMHLRHFSCNQDDREYMGESGFLQLRYNAPFNDGSIDAIQLGRRLYGRIGFIFALMT